MQLKGLVSNIRHNVHRSYQRRRTINPPSRSFNHLDSHDIAQVYGQVHCIVARLRVTDINAVQQQDNLFGSTASNGNVRLSTNRSSLTDIHANGVFQQIVNTLYRCLRNICTVEYSYHSRSLTLRQGCPRACHAHFFEHHLAGRCHRCRVCHHRMGADALGRGVGQRGHREHTAHHLPTQTGEKRIALVSELSEHEHRPLHVESWFVHLFFIKGD